MKKLKIAIVGSRSLEDYVFFRSRISYWIMFFQKEYKEDLDINIISGGASGIDSIASKYSFEYNYPLIEHKANWDRYGKPAGFIRNQQIAKECDILICFWDGKSKGAKNTYDIAKKKGRKVYLEIYE